MEIRMFEVGGCVRDELLGIRSKDIDFSVEVIGANNLDEAYWFMHQRLVDDGFKIFVENPEHVTIRAHFPYGHTLEKLTADFVLCRKEGQYYDGRRPSSVAVGTLADDLRRRDFTVNALARQLLPDGTKGPIIDQHDGVWDLEIRRLKFVGDPMERLREDGLRALRAIRFKITKGFEWAQETRIAMLDPEVASLLSGVSEDRRREELERCLHFDTLGTLNLIMHELPVEFQEAIFSGSLRLSATQKRDFVHAQQGGKKK